MEAVTHGTVEVGRFLLETIGRIRDAEPDFPAFVRISATEYTPDGYPIEEAWFALK